MKKFKIINLFILAIFAINFISCGGGKSDFQPTKQMEIKVKPQQLKISGTLGDYIEIVEGSYTLVIPPTAESGFESKKFEIKLKLKFFKKYPEKKLIEEYPDRTVYMDRPEMKLEFLDENSMPLSNMTSLKLWSGTEDDKQIVSLMKTGAGEYIASFQENTYENDMVLKALKDTLKIKTFSISGEMTASGYKPKGTAISSNNSDNSTVNSDNSNSNSNENWDEALASYEKYTNDYIALVKKMKKLKGKTDNSSIMEYTSLMTDALKLNQDAQEFGTKMEDAKSDLTPTQLAKYMKIQLKLTAAIAELSY
jgi:hypothetical protein